MTRTVIVEMRVKPDMVGDFAAMIERHAHNSRTLEEGCLAFDVNQDPDDPAVFVLYEVYRDEAAHMAHREMESFKRFSELAPSMVVPGPDGGLFQSRRILRRRAP